MVMQLLVKVLHGFTDLLTILPVAKESVSQKEREKRTFLGLMMTLEMNLSLTMLLKHSQYTSLYTEIFQISPTKPLQFPPAQTSFLTWMTRMT